METLRAYRRREKLTLGALAEKVGVTESQLSRIERSGKASLTTAARIEEVTGVPAAVVAQGLAEKRAA